MKVQEMRKQCEEFERPENLRSKIKVTLGIKKLEGIKKQPPKVLYKNWCS